MRAVSHPGPQVSYHPGAQSTRHNARLPQACQAEALHRDAINAWLRREEDRLRETGHEVNGQLRLTDAGYRADVPALLPEPGGE